MEWVLAMCFAARIDYRLADAIIISVLVGAVACLVRGIVIFSLALMGALSWAGGLLIGAWAAFFGGITGAMAVLDGHPGGHRGPGIRDPGAEGHFVREIGIGYRSQ